MIKRSKTLKTGDKVAWTTPQGRTTGVVKKKITQRQNLKSHKVAASREDPQYLVQSSKSGKLAAHKKSALKKSSR